MTKITVNGKSYDIPAGCSVSVVNNAVYVDGELVQRTDSDGVYITGNVEILTTDKGSITVTGEVGTIKAGGSVSAGDVRGDVEAGGSVSCGSVAGDVKAGGSISYGLD